MEWECGDGDAVVFVGCWLPDRSRFIPRRQVHRRLQSDGTGWAGEISSDPPRGTCESAVEVGKCGRRGLVWRSERSSGCVDAAGLRRAAGSEWASSSGRGVLLTCAAHAGGFRILDAACEHPVVGRLEPGENVFYGSRLGTGVELRPRMGFAERTEVRCLRYRGRDRDTLRLSARPITAATPKPSRPLKDQPLRSLLVRIPCPNQFLARGELGALEASVEPRKEVEAAGPGGGCLEAGVRWSEGAVWTSPDGGLKLRCAQDEKGRLSTLVQACLTPKGHEALHSLDLE